MNRKIVYTCITGDYDRPPAVLRVTEGWIYLLFTDSPVVNAGIWQVIRLPEADNAQQQARMVKLLFYNYLDKHHDINVWIDGRVDILCNLDKFVKQYHRNVFSALVHPHRNTTAGETDACIKLNKCNPEKARQQFLRYQAKGFADDIGLFATGIMVRNNDPSLVMPMHAWWKELNNNTLRDQLSLPFIAWDYGIKVNRMPWELMNSMFNLRKHIKHEVQR